jgi:hypothetical protein
VVFFRIQSALFNWDDFTQQHTSKRRRKYVRTSNVKLKKVNIGPSFAVLAASGAAQPFTSLQAHVLFCD